ncbi:aldo/keto reductase [Uliginosibacterium sediminicola]|uniref:Aldo/keto reductase n=1 Tax=Uliginosibacterium sediminicola TaxID=2024550 RepID=A0ABU9YVB1_9RHOO
MPAIALGTVQFGLDYGLTNQAGCISDREAERILRCAHDQGVQWLDTAAAYGNAETRLGELLAGDPYFSICSKLLPTLAEQSALALAPRSLDNSLTRLRRERLDALLLHSVGDLLGAEGDALWDWLLQQRAAGLVGSIGVSVYEQGEIEALLARYQPDWIQLPCSVFDQRLLASGTLEQLVARGVKVQARSLLLQGVVSLSPERLPPQLGALLQPLQRLQSAAQARGRDTLSLALAWAAAQTALELAVIGVTREQELQQCLEAFATPADCDWASFACSDSKALDPRQWRDVTRPN